MNIRAIAMAFASMSALAMMAPSAGARTLAIEDLDRLERVADARISPDGERILYTVTATDVAADTQRTSVWQVRWNGAKPVRLTDESGSARAPRWSPDGRWISFLRSGEEGGSQLWLLDSQGTGEAKRVTDIPGGLSGYAWSPDGQRLALVHQSEIPLRKDADGKEIPEPWVIDRPRFKEDAGDGYLHNRLKPQRIYLYDLGTKSFEPLTAGGEFDEDSPSWSPDGSRIAFVSNRDPEWEYTDYGDIFVAPAQSGSVPQRLTDFEGADYEPCWSPDGRQIAFLRGSEPKYWMYNQTGLAVVPAMGGAVRTLASSLDRDVGGPEFSEDGRSIRFIVADNRLRYPAQVSAADGQVKRLVDGPYRITSFTQAKGRIAVIATSDGKPDEVHALENGRLRPLTRHNEGWLRGIELTDSADVDFLAADGERVSGLLTKPVGYRQGRRYPTVLWLHGGPYGQDEHGFHPVRHLLAANGYAVLQVNFRGSLGRGKAFGRGIFADWGNRDVSDSLAGVDHAVELGIADPGRLAVGGWSYGGFMTNFLIASDTRFKAAISGAGSGTKTSLYGTDLYAHGNELEFGTPWGGTDVWMRVSRPLYQADRIRTPTLFIHGVKDYNVPVSGSEQMYRALKTLRVPTQLVIYPDEHHGIGRPSFARDLLRRYLDWYARYLEATP